jgi:Carboxypeptidase regulatory-like domain/TonB-dependent Receptor Plug Domain
MITTRVAALAVWALWDPMPRILAAQELPARQAKPAAYRVAGIVKDSTGAPIPEADVAVIESGTLRRQVATDAAGRFELRDIPAGPATIRVRRLGYQPRTVDVLVGATDLATFLEIIVTPLPAQLEEVLVNPNPVGRLREFYDHRQQRRSYARFLELADIRRLAPTSPSELFRSVPGITIRAASTGGNTIRIRGCQPTVWVDGQRIPGAELDEVVQASDIGGIEFYPSSAGIPPQYMDPSNRLCGLILVWTRSQ